MRNDVSVIQLYKDCCLPHPTSIRVFLLAPSVSPEAKIEGTLVVRTALVPDQKELDHKGGNLTTSCIQESHAEAFEALSYTWGNPSKPEVALINEVHVPIGQNLSDALRCLRWKHKSRVLWVDTLCINQADADECNAQVNMMDKIFAEASGTVAWTGTGSGNGEDVRECFDFFRWIATSKRSFLSPWEIEDAITQFNCADHRRQRLPTALTLEKLDAFYNRDWFNRVWVLQEVANSTKVTLCCDLCTVDLNDACVVLEKWFVPWVSALKLCSMRTEAMRAEGSICRVLHHYQKFQCRDPRDRLVACSRLMVGLWKRDWNNWGWKINYHHNVEANYIAFAQKVARHGYVTQLLECAARRFHIVASNSEPKLPSWVPDWRAQAEPMQPGGDATYLYSRDDVSGRPKLSTGLAQGNCLHVDAITIGTVKTVGDKDLQLIHRHSQTCTTTFGGDIYALGSQPVGDVSVGLSTSIIPSSKLRPGDTVMMMNVTDDCLFFFRHQTMDTYFLVAVTEACPELRKLVKKCSESQCSWKELVSIE